MWAPLPYGSLLPMRTETARHLARSPGSPAVTSTITSSRRQRDLDAWVAKLRSEGVTFLEGPYGRGDTWAVMIEGYSRVALELIEISRH